MFEFIPPKFLSAIKRLNLQLLTEIRFRADIPVMIEYDGINGYLSYNGFTGTREKGLIFSKEDADEFLYSLCEKSVYAYTKSIAKGFITTKKGERIGIGGKAVFSDNQVTNLTDVRFFNIRVPHRIEGCSDEIFARYRKEVKNTLIISPPGVGKTTVLRDLAESISKKLMINLLICDERGEIYPLMKNKDTVDCISFCDKTYAFECGIRALAPNVIITDEIFGENDLIALEKAMRSGVKVIATAHSTKPEDFFSLKSNERFKDFFELITVIEKKRNARSITVY